MPDATLNGISYHNKVHGLCGFAAALMATNGGGNRWFSDLKHIASSMQQFFEHCARSRVTMIAEIVNFTKAFKGFETYDITGLIHGLERAAQGQPVTPKQLSAAMTPNAVLYYLRNFRNCANARLVDPDERPQQCIVGLSDGSVSMNVHGGLAHWVYYRGGTLYSYGNAYGGGDLDAALKTFNAVEEENYDVSHIIVFPKLDQPG